VLCLTNGGFNLEEYQLAIQLHEKQQPNWV
jgi:hypothetical protein